MPKRRENGADNLSCEEIQSRIEKWIHHERNRAILRRRLIDGITFEKLSEEFELSVRQVKNIVYKGESKIF